MKEILKQIYDDILSLDSVNDAIEISDRHVRLVDVLAIIENQLKTIKK